MPLRIRRGTNAERLLITPLQGELIYTTDSRRLFVGDGSTVGGVGIGSSSGGGGDFEGTFTGDFTGNLVGNVTGNVSGNVTGDTFGDLYGSVFAKDSTLLVDSMHNVISNGDITLRNNVLTTLTKEVSNLGKLIGVLKLNGDGRLTQLYREWDDSSTPYEKSYGISSGFEGLKNEVYTSRGSISSPETLNSGDSIFASRYFGHDGNGYFISSSIVFGVDNQASIAPGFVPGKISLATIGSFGINILAFDSEGRLGVNVTNPSATLDVAGDAVISGIVRAGSFEGVLLGQDSTVLIDGLSNLVSNGIISLENDVIKVVPSSTSPLGFSTGLLRVSSDNYITQIYREWPEFVLPYEVNFGLSNGFLGLSVDYNASRGTLDVPTTLVQNDTVHSNRAFGYDGGNFVISSQISHTVDNEPVGPGNVPGKIVFNTFGPQGVKYMSFDSYGRLLINRSGTASVELEVEGEAVINGNLFCNDIFGLVISGGSVTGGSVLLAANSISTTDSSALAVENTTNFMSDVTIDGRIDSKEYTSSSLGAPELSSATELKFSAGVAVMVVNSPFRLAKFTTTERDALLASNGDMIYNTTTNKFQGYENGAWVDLV